jgi:outer membrane receptor protein involved in Fe transport
VTNASEDISNTIVFGGFPDVGLFTLEKAGRAAYVRDEAGAGRATVSGGYRYDAAEHTFTPSTPRERTFHSHAADLGATLTLSPDASVYASLSRSFRYPVLDELFDFFSNTIVSGLEPQRSLDVEGGLRVQHGPVRASVNVFHLTTDDEILYNPTGGTGFGANENLDGRSRRVGVEFAAATRVRSVDLGGTVTLLKATIDGGQFKGKDMPSVAPGRVSAQARIPLPRRMSAGLDASYVSARWLEGDFANQFREQDGYFLLDARLTHTHDRMRLFLDLKNLLNTEYDEYGVLGGFPTERSFYPSAGFHALVGVDLRLTR